MNYKTPLQSLIRVLHLLVEFISTNISKARSFY